MAASRYRGAMARALRDPRLRNEQPGQKPLLQGHLKKGGQAASTPAATTAATEASSADGAAQDAASADEARSSQPAETDASQSGAAGAVRGKATKSPADVATRPHLEGAEQGPQ